MATRKGTIKCTQQPISHFVSSYRLSSQYRSFLSTLNFIGIPQTLQEAFTDRHWVQAIKEDMIALEKNETWEIVDLRNGKKNGM